MDLRQPRLQRTVALVVTLGVVGGLAVSPAGVSASKGSVLADVALGKLQTRAVQVGSIAKDIPQVSNGLQQAALNILGVEGDFDGDFEEFRDEERHEGADAGPDDRVESDQFSVNNGSLGCKTRNSAGTNVRVNQDCTFRRQAEELVKINPINPNNIIAGQNDSRIGYNKCGFDFSFDAGKSWGDGIPPFYQRENHPELDGPTTANPNRNTILGGVGTSQTYDAGSDPALAFDSAGRAFYSCIVFDVNDNANGILVTSSPAGAGGSFYNNVSATGRNFVVVEDNPRPTAPGLFPAAVVHDKEFIVADSNPSSPNRDNVYITWTVFQFKNTCQGTNPATPRQCASPIFGSMSTDHGLTWSTPEEISGNNPQICFFGNILDPSRNEHDCDLNQGSDPVVLPNGDLALVWRNGNTGATDPNAQQLGTHCRPAGKSELGTAHFNCGMPSRVGTDAIFSFAAGIREPRCSLGRGAEECIPSVFIRTSDFPRLAVDKSNGNLFAVWQDYRNAEFDIILARSNDAGLTWTEATAPVNSSTGFDEYMPAVDVGTDHSVAVSFYQSTRHPLENNPPTHTTAQCGGNTTRCFTATDPGVFDGISSYWLSGRKQTTIAPATPFVQVKVSPDFAAPDGGQAGFNGDYSALAVWGNTAYPLWSDTRNPAVVTDPPQGIVHDEDIFIDARPIPGS